MPAISLLRADGISHAYGDRTVLTDLSLTVSAGQRLGLLGDNGAGKSTLLRLLAGVEQPDRGDIQRPESTGYLAQEVRFDDAAPLSALIEDAIAPLRAVEREIADAAASLTTDPTAEARYAAALERADAVDLWSLDSRRDALLAGLGVAGISLDRTLREVSGGQRSRVALAALLLARPDALLLDEPTNHLDDDAVAFLAATLQGWRGAIVFASHDRDFLDEVATGLLDIDPSRAGVTRFGGNYSEYLTAKAAERARWEERFAAEEKELATLQANAVGSARTVAHDRGPRDNDKFITRFKGGNVQKTIARRVRSVEGRIDDLIETRVGEPPEVLKFRGIARGSHPLEGEVLRATGVRVDGRLRLDELVVASGDRVLVTGANGAGKSTLLGVLAGRIRPDAGTDERRRGLRVALLEQDVRWADPSLSARVIYGRALGEQRAGTVPLASLGLLTDRDADRPVGTLSIGQQRRTALALIIAKPPHVFLLDEPTNHLSLALATELEDALGSYPGAVVVASHDRWLRRRWGGREVRL